MLLIVIIHETVQWNLYVTKIVSTRLYFEVTHYAYR